jgi:hypothetical protein
MDPYQELNRRILSPLYLLCALEVFRANALAVVIREADIKVLFPQEYFPDERIAWIQQDTARLFPYLYWVWGKRGDTLICLSKKKYCPPNCGQSGREGYAKLFIPSGVWDAVLEDTPLFLELSSQEMDARQYLERFITSTLGLL